MANRQQIKNMYKVSRRLQKAFKEVSYLCAKYLSLSSSNQQKNRNSSPQNSSPKKPNEHENQRDDKDDNKKKKIIRINRNKPSQKSEVILERPKPPLTPFFMFMTKNKEKIAADYPSLTGQQVTNLMAEVWQGLTDEEKQPYADQYESSKAIYERRLKQYYAHNPQQKGKKQTKAEKEQQKISQLEEQRLKERVQMLKKMKNKQNDKKQLKEKQKQQYAQRIFPFKPQTFELLDSDHQNNKIIDKNDKPAQQC